VTRFVLASASPARLATLRQAGVEPEVIVSGVDEDAIHADSTRELVTLLAVAKAHAVAAQVGADALVLGCDSLLELDGRPLGKPGSADVARERWRAMRGRDGTLWTGHHLIDTATQRTSVRAIATTVHFADASDAEIDAYCATGEPSAVAGAFTVDGLGGWLVAGIDGDPHNVVGVSLPALRAMLSELGHSLTSIGWPLRDGIR
jgi:septum formation protein